MTGRLTSGLCALALITSCVSRNPPDGDHPPLPGSNEVALQGDGVVVIGDSGTGQAGQLEVAKAIEDYCLLSENCDFGLMLGDNFYPAGVKSVTDPQWDSALEKPYKRLGNLTFYPVLGNHDYLGSWIAQIQYKSPNRRWVMPHRYYKIRTPYAEIYALDVEHFDKAQEVWLKQNLLASQTRWQILYGHRPLFSSGGHGATVELQALLKPLLKQFGVDLYLSGHDHHLELIEKKDDSVGYVISGAASKTRGLNPGADTLFAKSTLGFVHLKISESSLEVTFVDSKAHPMYTRIYR